MNDEYILNIKYKKSEINNYKLTFLDNYDNFFDIKEYYNLYNSLDENNIKNLYNYIYIKSYLIKNKLHLNNFELKKKVVTKINILDNIFNEFNNDNDISKIIFIINSTIRYIF